MKLPLIFALVLILGMAGVNAEEIMCGQLETRYYVNENNVCIMHIHRNTCIPEGYYRESDCKATLINISLMQERIIELENKVESLESWKTEVMQIISNILEVLKWKK